MAPAGSRETVYSDATLTILTSDMVPNIETKFTNLYPTNISAINFTATDNDVNYVTMDVTFKYQIYTVSKI